MMNKSAITCRIGAAFLLAVGAWGTAGAGSLDQAVLNTICDDADAGADILDQCTVFDLDSPNRTAAANGNNLGITGSQGRTRSDVRDRLNNLRDGDEMGGGSAADWTTGKLGMFLSADGRDGERDATANVTGNDSTTLGATLGGDWRFSDALVAGIALTYTSADTDYDGGAGNLDTDGYGATIYASYAPEGRFYFDGYLGFTMQNLDSRRNISFTSGGTPVTAVANGDTDSDEFTGGVSVGADYGQDAWSYGPHAQIDYSNTDVDSYSETGGSGFAIRYGSQTIKSLQSVLGAHVSRAISTDWGVAVPHARLDWVHEFKDDNRRIAANFVQSPTNTFEILTDSPDRNFGRAGIGISALTANGWVSFADYQYQFAHSFQDEHSFSLGLRREF